MLLSILIPGKNDNHRENVQKTLLFNINKTISNISNLCNNDVELVLCDWGSNNKIVDSLTIGKCKNFKCVYVPEDICKKYNGVSSYSIVHPINAAFRRSSGKYVIFWDSDCYVTESNFLNLYNFVVKMNEENDLKFYWGSRRNIPYNNYMQYEHFTDMDKHLESGVVYNKDSVSIEEGEFQGCSISLLMNREIWEKCTGWWEQLPYWGWQDIELHRRLLTRYSYGGDLERQKISFYHLTYTGAKTNTCVNPFNCSSIFEANSEPWGLIDENLEIIDKSGLDRAKLIKRIVDIAATNKEGHLGSSLSVLDILYVLYKRFVTDFKTEDRNRLIFSKGHGSLGLYAILEHLKLLEENLDTFCKFDSNLGGHPFIKVKGVEIPTGSLGHGLPIGVGMAMGYKAQSFKNKIYVIIGDGELNEGSNWEALLLASHHNLDNLCCILDYNRSNDRALKLDVISEKIKSFGWDVREIDGHNENEIYLNLATSCNKPLFIIANTIKGKGVSLMENNPEWHHKFPNKEEYEKILTELS